MASLSKGTLKLKTEECRGMSFAESLSLACVVPESVNFRIFIKSAQDLVQRVGEL